MVTLNELQNLKEEYNARVKREAYEWATEYLKQLNKELTLVASLGSSYYVTAPDNAKAKALAELTKHLNPRIAANNQVWYSW